MKPAYVQVLQRKHAASQNLKNKIPPIIVDDFKNILNFVLHSWSCSVWFDIVFVFQYFLLRLKLNLEKLLLQILSIF